VTILLLRNPGLRTRAFSPSAVLAGSTVVGVLLFLLIGWNIATMGAAYKVLESDAMRLQRLLDRMNFLDAKLTMAASMAAATGDPHWEQVYAPLEVEVRWVFDSIANRAIGLGERSATRRAISAADTLIEIEHRVFALVRVRRMDDAHALISGERYRRSKDAYADATAGMMMRLQAHIDRESSLFHQRLARLSILAAVSLVILLATLAGAWLLTRRHHEHKKLQEAEQARAARQLRSLALYDSLTGLPNRTLLLDRLNQVLASPETAGASALMFLDLDRFKRINDSLGHAAGDLLLVEVGRRLNAAVAHHGIAARMGGDEFAVLATRDVGQGAVLVLARQALNAIEKPLSLRESEVSTSASMGIVQLASGYSDPLDVLRDADLAMYEAKSRGPGGYAVFDASMHDVAVHLHEIENALRGALERGEFLTCYQPIIDGRSDGIAGWEALVRWNHPTRGLLGPAAFLPVAEETGSVVPIDRWVLHEALRQLRAWREEFAEAASWYVSVNLSGRQFYSADLVDHVAALLRDAGVPPDALHLEVTEGVLIDHVAAARMLASLKELGVRIDLDDFGTGYSSLSYLHRFDVDGLKIDRSFVTTMDRNAQNHMIVRSVLALADSLGLRATAEGVETTEVAMQLRAAGCAYLQGYSFSRPLGSREAQAWFTARGRDHVSIQL
jgi:diguanylate cyclase (GGDEF)-like protein